MTSNSNVKFSEKLSSNFDTFEKNCRYDKLSSLNSFVVIIIINTVAHVALFCCNKPK
jgi:hypothetical protein